MTAAPTTTDVNPGAVIAAVSSDFVLNSMDRWIRERRFGNFLVFFEGNLLSRLAGNDELARALNNAALVLPDGFAPALLATWHQGRKVARVPGPDFMPSACAVGVPRGWRHFFYGGGDGVALKVADLLSVRFPGLKVAGTYCPPFRPLSPEEDAAVCDMINRSGADIVWVALGGPKQELWMNAHTSTLQVPVMLGIGAAFDFLANTRPRAPVFLRRLGLEWMFRMFTGGPRLFRRNMRAALVTSNILLRTYFGRRRGMRL